MTETTPDAWTQSIVYREIVARPELRSMVDAAAAHQSGGMPAGKFLEQAEKLLEAAGGPTAPLALLGEVLQPVYARMGIKTGKMQSQRFELPPGRAILAALCSLAGRGQTLKAARQAADGLVLEAVLPSDLFAMEGSLIVTLKRDGAGTLVEAATHIPGQMMDWGKSARAIHTLFEEIEGLATLQP
jgi:hypothetical protein